MGEQLEGLLNTEEIKSIKRGNPLEKICSSFRVPLTALLLLAFVGCTYINREKQRNQPQNLSQNPRSSNSLPQLLPYTKFIDIYGHKRSVVSWVSNTGFIRGDSYKDRECFIETMPLAPCYKEQVVRLPLPRNLLLQGIYWYSFSQDEKILYLMGFGRRMDGTETDNFGKDFGYKDYPVENRIYSEDVYEINLETGEFKKITRAQELITTKIKEAIAEQKLRTKSNPKESLGENQRGQIMSEYAISHPSISPNGTKIAYEWCDGIYLQDPAIGGEPKKLFKGYDPSWCDEENLICVDPTGNKILKRSINNQERSEIEVIADFISSDKIEEVFSPKHQYYSNSERVVFVYKERGTENTNIGIIPYINSSRRERWGKYREVTHGERKENYNNPYWVGNSIVFDGSLYCALKEPPYKARKIWDRDIFIIAP